jgi:ribosomal protein L37AE/L43A
MLVWLCKKCSASELGPKFQDKAIGGVGPWVCADCGRYVKERGGIDLVLREEERKQ